MLELDQMRAGRQRPLEVGPAPGRRPSTGRRTKTSRGRSRLARSWSRSTCATREAVSERGRRAASPSAIFHLAAQIDVRKSLADPAFDASINVGGTANVLEAARAAGARRVVFASTGGAIYGEGEGSSCRSTRRPVRADAPYGQSKFAAEGYLGLFERLHGLSGVALRLGNVYGPRQDPLGEAGVIAIFCGKLLTADGRRSSATAARPATTCSSTTSSRRSGGGRVGATEPSTSAPASRPTCWTAEALASSPARAISSPTWRRRAPGEVQRISLDAGRAARRARLGGRTKSLEEGLRLTLESV